MRTLRQHARTKLKDERGVAALEFAIVSQLLLIMLYAMLSYGFMFALNHNLTQATAEGARATISYAGLDPAGFACDQTKSRLTFQAATDNAHCTAEVKPCPSDPSVNCIHVTLFYDYSAHPLIPSFLIGGLLPSTLTTDTWVGLG